MSRRLNSRAWTLILLALGLSVCLVLLVTGYRVLVWETRVNPGQTYVVGEWGDLGKTQQPQLVCRYFTGRSVQVNVLWYSPNNLLGRDQCPFLARNE
jgi:hypothetical protein